MEWTDLARTHLQDHWPDNYENFVHLGVLNGSVFRIFADWVANDFAPSHHSFQPLEIAVVSRQNAADLSQKQTATVVRSNMCHDFVTDALWVLHNNGVQLSAEKAVFRDHIILYATSADEVSHSGFAEQLRSSRKWLRYLRQLTFSVELIRKQFTHAREAFIYNWRLGLNVFLHTEHRDYRLKLTPPFLNYCYLPLAIPPKVHDPLGDIKLCALGMVANASNVTVPWPWGVMLAAEERLDRDEAFLAIVLVAIAAAVVGSTPGRVVLLRASARPKVAASAVPQESSVSPASSAEEAPRSETPRNGRPAAPLRTPR
ncbi:unnamed protein product [Polarella glacialis]|uniref:Uncharacterized protein n=1 Tax=Polarella glacialis TaxID=89957 RepID=A0A813GHX0_POLGL|nr:unnamed protein product [Polarella glacialis]